MSRAPLPDDGVTASGRHAHCLLRGRYSPPRSFLPLRILPQGSRDFYIRAHRASLPPHVPDMLAVRIQAIDGARTFTLQDSQPCRPLPSVLRFKCHLTMTPARLEVRMDSLLPFL